MRNIIETVVFIIAVIITVAAFAATLTLAGALLVAALAADTTDTTEVTETTVTVTVAGPVCPIEPAQPPAPRRAWGRRGWQECAVPEGGACPLMSLRSSSLLGGGEHQNFQFQSQCWDWELRNGLPLRRY